MDFFLNWSCFDVLIGGGELNKLNRIDKEIFKFQTKTLKKSFGIAETFFMYMCSSLNYTSLITNEGGY